MTDLKIDATAQLAYEIAQRAGEPGACDTWAHVKHAVGGADRDPRLWPRDRGEIAGIGYCVSSYVAHKGMIKVALTQHGRLAEIGVPAATQLALLAVLTGAPVAGLSVRDVDHVIQVGLFGEVLYP